MRVLFHKIIHRSSQDNLKSQIWMNIEYNENFSKICSKICHYQWYPHFEHAFHGYNVFLNGTPLIPSMIDILDAINHL